MATQPINSLACLHHPIPCRNSIPIDNKVQESFCLLVKFIGMAIRRLVKLEKLENCINYMNFPPIC